MNPLKGKRFVEVTEFKTKKDWAMFIKGIADEQYPKAKRITLVMDNYNTHTASAFYETFRPKEAKGYGIDLNLYLLQNMEVG